MNNDFTHLSRNKAQTELKTCNSAEPELDYWLFEKKIGLPSLWLYLRTLIGLIFLLGGPLLLVRFSAGSG